MATPVQIVNNQTNNLVDTPQTVYTAPVSPSTGTTIDSFTASNTSAVNASYKAYIVSASGTAINPQKPFQIVVFGEIDLGSGIVGQAIPPGGSLRVEASAINSIYFTVTGREN